MTDLTTIARPYAEALFAVSTADLEVTQQWLNNLKLCAEDKQLQNFVLSPKTSREMVLNVINDLTQKQLPEAAKKFLLVVLENGRFEALPAIANQFDQLKKLKDGVVKAMVYSAFPIEAAALAGLKIDLEKHFKSKLDLQVKIATDLIGGVRVVVGDEVLDTSVKAYLETMKQTLIA